MTSPRNGSSFLNRLNHFLVKIERLGGRGILGRMKYSVLGDEASRGVLSEIRGLLSLREKLVMTAYSGTPWSEVRGTVLSGRPVLLRGSCRRTCPTVSWRLSISVEHRPRTHGERLRQ